MFQGAWDTGTYLRQLEKKKKRNINNNKGWHHLAYFQTSSLQSLSGIVTTD